MRSGRILLAVQVAVAATLLLITSLALSARGLSFTPTSAHLLDAVALGVALLVLGFFNVWLPRGDAVDTTVSVAFAAAVLLHDPLVASGVVLLARCATVALRPEGLTLHRVLEQVSRRVILVCGAFAALYFLAPTVLFILGLRPSGEQLIYLGAVAIVFIALDALLEQAHGAVQLRVPLWARLVGLARLQGWMLAAEMSAAVLAVVMFPALQYWAILITVGLLLVMRQSFALLLEVRASYTSTVEVLARSLEAYDPQRRGHAERVARMVGSAGRLIGMQGRSLERMTYAALFHDVGRLGADSLDEEPSSGSAQVLGGVGFLAGALPILRVLDAAGEVEASLDEEDLIGAYLIASLSAFDSAVTMHGHEDDTLAATIGARLYAATRRSVDRVIQRIEDDVKAGTQSDVDLSDVVL